MTWYLGRHGKRKERGKGQHVMTGNDQREGPDLEDAGILLSLSLSLSWSSKLAACCGSQAVSTTTSQNLTDCADPESSASYFESLSVCHL